MMLGLKGVPGPLTPGIKPSVMQSSDLLDELGWVRLEPRKVMQLAVVVYKDYNNLSIIS